MSIFVTVKYPNKEGSRFDMDYYIDNHLPLVTEKFGEAMLSLKACKGIATPNPEVAPPYQVMAIMEIKSLKIFKDVFSQHGAEINRDFTNYTDVEPVIQISDNLLT